jgi:hypothetical protein
MIRMALKILFQLEYLTAVRIVQSLRGNAADCVLPRMAMPKIAPNASLIACSFSIQCMAWGVK